MRFSRQDGAKYTSLDPVRSTSKFALRACRGSGYSSVTFSFIVHSSDTCHAEKPETWPAIGLIFALSSNHEKSLVS